MAHSAPTLEIGVTTLNDARRAAEGGAQTLEIFENLALGGLTPPLETVKAIREAVSLPLRVMIRLYAESFVYTPAEAETMLKQIETVKSVGVDGIVFGALTQDGFLDIPLIQTISQAAAPLPVTVHRALDVSREPDAALERLHGMVSRILTSGPAATAWEGRETLRRWVQTHSTYFRFASSGGITLEQLPELVRVTNANEFHIGGAARTNGVVVVEKVRRLRQVLESAAASS